MWWTRPQDDDRDPAKRVGTQLSQKIRELPFLCSLYLANSTRTQESLQQRVGKSRSHGRILHQPFEGIEHHQGEGRLVGLVKDLADVGHLGGFVLTEQQSRRDDPDEGDLALQSQSRGDGGGSGSE